MWLGPVRYKVAQFSFFGKYLTNACMDLLVVRFLGACVSALVAMASFHRTSHGALSTNVLAALLVTPSSR